jgi:MFS transporter, PPP family, 3-phenylpropionic acid transporter
VKDKKAFDKSRIIVPLIYFIIFAGYGSFGQFNLYLKGTGLSGFRVGLITGMLPLVMLFTLSFWGMIADRFGRKYVLLLVLIMDSAVTLTFLLYGGFIYIFSMTFLYAIFSNPKGSLMDSVTMDYVNKSGTTDYGKIRLWGAVGFSIASYLVGYFISENNIKIIFPIAAGINILAGVLIFSFLKFEKKVHVEEEIKFKNLKIFFEDKTILVFFILIVFFGVFSSPLSGFYNFYLQDIGASNKIVGLAFAIMAIGELPFYYLGSKIVKKFGTKNVLMIAMLATGIRMSGYYFISNPYHALILDTTQGICYSIFIVAVVEYISDALPEKWRATGIAIMWTAYNGVGMYFGLLLNGILYDNFQGKGMMLIQGLLTILVAIATYIVFRIRDRRDRLMKNINYVNS